MTQPAIHEIYRRMERTPVPADHPRAGNMRASVLSRLK